MKEIEIPESLKAVLVKRYQHYMAAVIVAGEALGVAGDFQISLDQSRLIVAAPENTEAEGGK